MPLPPRNELVLLFAQLISCCLVIVWVVFHVEEGVCFSSVDKAVCCIGLCVNLWFYGFLSCQCILAQCVYAHLCVWVCSCMCIFIYWCMCVLTHVGLLWEGTQMWPVVRRCHSSIRVFLFIAQALLNADLGSNTICHLLNTFERFLLSTWVPDGQGLLPDFFSLVL